MERIMWYIDAYNNVTIHLGLDLLPPVRLYLGSS